MTPILIRRPVPRWSSTMLLAALGCSLALGSSDRPTSDELLQQLRQTVRQELQGTNLTNEARSEWSRVADQLERRTPALRSRPSAAEEPNRDPTEDDPTLDSILAELKRLDPPGAVLGLCSSVETAIWREDHERDDALAPEFEAIAFDTGRDLLAARTASAVDPLLDRLDAARARLDTLQHTSRWAATRVLSPRLGKARIHIEAMQQAAQLWQSGMVVLEAGRPTEAIGLFAGAVARLREFTTPPPEAVTNRMLALLNAAGFIDPDLAIRKASAAAGRALDTGNSADLDAALASIADVSSITSQFFSLPRFSTSCARLREARSQLQSLQDILAAQSAGHAARAQELLRSLVNGSEPVVLVPRSRLLSLSYQWQGTNAPPTLPPPAGPVTPPPAVDPSPVASPVSLSEVQRLDDIEPTLARWESNPRRAHGVSEMQLESELRAIAQFRNKFRTGGGLGQMRFTSESPSTALRLELFREIAPSAVPDAKANPPASGESTQDYARRLLNTATAQTNWAQAGRVLAALQTFGIADAVLNANDLKAVTLFSSGLRRERAGEFALAAQAFQQALSLQTEAVPPELIGKHLAAIRQTHPKDYEQAVAWTVNPPIPEWVLNRPDPSGRNSRGTNTPGSVTNAPAARVK